MKKMTCLAVTVENVVVVVDNDNWVTWQWHAPEADHTVLMARFSLSSTAFGIELDEMLVWGPFSIRTRFQSAITLA
jgi:hypothetical protein